VEIKDEKHYISEGEREGCSHWCMYKRWIALPMIRYAGVGVILILMYTEVRAEIMYVSEISKITSRAGPGIEYKVISEIRTGQPVEITQQGRWWTRIRLSDGREGFVLSRFLTKKKPNTLVR